MGFGDALKSFFSGPGGQEEAAAIYRQNGGCGARIYANGIDDGRDETTDLFYEIRSADIDRTTTDIAGSWTIHLLPTDVWDELIKPDDFIRIFIGDQIVTTNNEPDSYNFASGSLDQNSALGDSLPDATGISIPLPGSVAGDGIARAIAGVARLIMHERMIGKVDRVQRVTGGPGPNAGQTTEFIISGRSMGSIVQDISLYYNEFLAPLNAVNIFLDSTVSSVDATPDEILGESLAIVLTSIPFPQWTLPNALVADLNYTKPGELQSLREKNKAFVEEKVKAYKQGLAQKKTTPQPTDLKGSAIAKLDSLLDRSGNLADNSPFSAISIEGFFATFGKCYNRNFLNSTTTGFHDLLKHLSNEPFNEFWFDLCPGGEPEGGLATSARPVPSFCVRQRPYNITSDLLTGIAKYIVPDTQKALSSFPPQETADISSSLLDIMDGSFSVMGPMQQPTVSLDGGFESYSDATNAAGYTPTVLPGGYEVGLSGHDRLNMWLCLGSCNTGQSDGTGTRTIAAEAGGFNLSPESIKKYGMRVMEVSTPYAQAKPGTTQDNDLGQTLGTFSRTLANWYFMNPSFLNGRISCRFLKDARIGVPVKYFETRITPSNPYPKMELFYVQGVSDHFEYGQPVTTSLTVIRGLRYDLGANAALLPGPDAETLIDTIAGFFS